MWTEATFSGSLAWHWPDHHWQCNWPVAWTSSRMSADKRRTLRATIVTIFNHMTRDIAVFFKFDTIFTLFFGNYHNFILLTFARYCGNILKASREILYWFHCYLAKLAFQRWKNFENPLRVWCTRYYFFGDTVYYTLHGESSYS